MAGILRTTEEASARVWGDGGAGGILGGGDGVAKINMGTGASFFIQSSKPRHMFDGRPLFHIAGACRAVYVPWGLCTSPLI